MRKEHSLTADSREQAAPALEISDHQEVPSGQRVRLYGNDRGGELATDEETTGKPKERCMEDE